MRSPNHPDPSPPFRTSLQTNRTPVRDILTIAPGKGQRSATRGQSPPRNTTPSPVVGRGQGEGFTPAPSNIRMSLFIADRQTDRSLPSSRLAQTPWRTLEAASPQHSRPCQRRLTRRRSLSWIEL
jgi:hypothetical protein